MPMAAIVLCVFDTVDIYRVPTVWKRFGILKKNSRALKVWNSVISLIKSGKLPSC
jgi:hypothetical protein